MVSGTDKLMEAVEESMRRHALHPGRRAHHARVLRRQRQPDLPEPPRLLSTRTLYLVADFLAARREHAVRLRAAGLTLQGVGDRLGMTRERVRQILDKVCGV